MKRNNKAKNKSTSNLMNNNILNQRLQNELYDDNSEYEIPPITLRNKNENNLKYMEKLESKIRTQAKKIADLNKYKYYEDFNSFLEISFFYLRGNKLC